MTFHGLIDTTGSKEIENCLFKNFDSTYDEFIQNYKPDIFENLESRIDFLKNVMKSFLDDLTEKQKIMLSSCYINNYID